MLCYTCNSLLYANSPSEVSKSLLCNDLMYGTLDAYTRLRETTPNLSSTQHEAAPWLAGYCRARRGVFRHRVSCRPDFFRAVALDWGCVCGAGTGVCRAGCTLVRHARKRSVQHLGRHRLRRRIALDS